MTETFKKPRALKPGDLIAVVAPAYPLREKLVKKAERRLQKMGYRVRIFGDVYKRDGYLAGSDEERASAFMEAWTDPGVAAVMPGTGGFGVTRMLDRLDWDALARRRPVFMGFSDITALHLAIQKNLRLVTFHGPNVVFLLGSEKKGRAIAQRYFQRSIFRKAYFDDEGKKKPKGWIYDAKGTRPKPRILNPGKARGRLTGGNLALISALMGTPYEIETAGRVLFIEDIDEAPYRIDRMLRQLEMAGKLSRLAGVILGGFKKCVAEKPEKSLSLDEIFEHYFAGRAYPVIRDFPAGHIKANAALPLGARLELRAEKNQPVIRLLENPISLA